MQRPQEIDIIIISFAKDQELKLLTEQTVSSLMSSEDPHVVKFNVLVIESNHSLAPFQFEHTKTIYPDMKFGYNSYMNIGINATSSKYLCLCNNDLIFHKGWTTNILKQMELDPDMKSVSPYCPVTHTDTIPDNGSNVISTENGILIGWCIFLKREIISITGLLDENIKFWFADNDYGNTLKKHHIKHGLVTSSKVTHLGSKTHTILSDMELFEYTYGQFLYFDLKWNKKTYLSYRLKSLLLPIFRYFYLNRSTNNLLMLSCRGMAKLYGGLR